MWSLQMDSDFHQQRAGAPCAGRAGDSSPTAQVQISSYLHHLLSWHHRVRHFSSLHSPNGIPYTDSSASSGNYDQWSSPRCWLPQHSSLSTQGNYSFYGYHLSLFEGTLILYTHSTLRCKHWQGARRAVFRGKEDPDIFRTKSCYKKRQRHLIASSYTKHIWGGQKCCRSHFQPPQNILQSLLLHVSPSAESFLEISTQGDKNATLQPCFLSG